MIEFNSIIFNIFYILFALSLVSLSSTLGSDIKWHELEHLSESEKFYPSFYYEQKLDHSNPSDVRTFQQRYMVNEDYFKNSSDGPAFLYIGGESAMNGVWMTTQQPIKYAEKYKGLFFQLEHRYYGLSGPIRDNTTTSRQYLTSEQALSDLAQFIVAMTEKYNLNPQKWITIGGSYAANLATWMRYKYPHLVAGSVAASAPVLAQLNFPEYLKIVEEAIRNRSEVCGDQLTTALQEMEEKMNSSLGRRELQILFVYPFPLNKIAKSPYYTSHFYEEWVNIISNMVQYNRDNTTTQGINFCCDIMNNPKRTPLENFAHFYRQKIHQPSRNLAKRNLFASNWVFQTCNEFGYFRSSSNEAPLFGDLLPLEYEIEDCSRGFGEEYSESFIEAAVERTNVNYGGLNPVGLTNVISVHGTIDPWHVLGFTKDLNKFSPVIMIEDASHCQVLLDIAPNEVVPPQLPEAQERIMDIIGTWIK